MLETVLTAVMASAAVESELEGAGAQQFAQATCRHFALLFAAGWASMVVSHIIIGFRLYCKLWYSRAIIIFYAPIMQTPPSAPPSSRVVKYAALAVCQLWWPPSSTFTHTCCLMQFSKDCASPMLMHAKLWWNACVCLWTR